MKKSEKSCSKDLKLCDTWFASSLINDWLTPVVRISVRLELGIDCGPYMEFSKLATKDHKSVFQHLAEVLTVFQERLANSELAADRVCFKVELLDRGQYKDAEWHEYTCAAMQRDQLIGSGTMWFSDPWCKNAVVEAGFKPDRFKKKEKEESDNALLEG